MCGIVGTSDRADVEFCQKMHGTVSPRFHLIDQTRNVVSHSVFSFQIRCGYSLINSHLWDRTSRELNYINSMSMSIACFTINLAVR